MGRNRMRGISNLYGAIALIAVVLSVFGVVAYVATSYQRPIVVKSVDLSARVTRLQDGSYKTVVKIYNAGTSTITVSSVTPVDADGNEITPIKTVVAGNIKPNDKGLIIIYTDTRPDRVVVSLCVEGYCYMSSVDVE